MLFMMLAVSNAHARKGASININDPNMPLSIIIAASTEYNIHPRLLHALYLAERGKLGGQSVNKNGSIDYGPFQINSIFLGQLSAVGISSGHLTNSAIVNARVAAWRLSSEIVRAGDTWSGVGNYRSRKIVYHTEEINRVAHYYQLLAGVNYEYYNNYYNQLYQVSANKRPA